MGILHPLFVLMFMWLVNFLNHLSLKSVLLAVRFPCGELGRKIVMIKETYSHYYWPWIVYFGHPRLWCFFSPLLGKSLGVCLKKHVSKKGGEYPFVIWFCLLFRKCSVFIWDKQQDWQQHCCYCCSYYYLRQIDIFTSIAQTYGSFSVRDHSQGSQIQTKSCWIFLKGISNFTYFFMLFFLLY